MSSTENQKPNSASSKNFKFIFTAKQPRKAKPLSCPRKGLFRPHTMKITKDIVTQKPKNIVKTPTSHSNSPENSSTLELVKAKNVTEEVPKLTTVINAHQLPPTHQYNNYYNYNQAYPQHQQSTNFNLNFTLPNPLNYKIYNSSQMQKLRSFIYHHFSLGQGSLNEGQISQFLNLIPSWEFDIMERLLSNSLDIKLHYPYEPPVYRGPANNITSMGLSNNKTGGSIINPKLIAIRESLDELELHLIKLFFKYSNPFFTAIHPDWFHFQLKYHLKNVEFQALLSIVLCVACSYLAVEPYHKPVNNSHLAEFYYERFFGLSSMIDLENTRVMEIRIQSLMVSCQLDYGECPRIFGEVYSLSKKLGWFSYYSLSTEEILNLRPAADDLVSNYNWEQNIVSWCFFIFYSTIVLNVKLPIEGFRFDLQMPNILPALSALFSNCNPRGWTGSLEARLVYYLYLGMPIIDRARLYNHNTISLMGVGLYPNLRQQEEIDSIKFNLNAWKEKFTKFTQSCQFKQSELAMITGILFYYHHVNLQLLMPHLPENPSQLDDPKFVKLYSDFLLDSASISLLMSCQGIWMILYGGGVKNFVCSIAWSGVRLFLHLTEWTPPSTTSRISMLVELGNILNQNLIRLLKSFLSFSFQRLLNETLVQKRGLIFWLELRKDQSLVDLYSGFKTRSGCLPPKLSRNSQLELLS
ncbi:hypothetical protein CONCODRAFT_80301 [Conidiobolus coronatus NRRL 28638]|uniref:Transcription factor domain-containing protein n=1 Tax=Conidiobolus coronatus (strain ATCC 28846 / CBS 209.66 / NRRL 28638) TaxID=796925 RepID=A0A137NW42_CONC2|nr:hypothetical protein CONCODRAFT_80301 [Conidiobolus coronatus NRRL 28638]|eukprot:KXN67040.1 hypothetical protein CONCODRAFT_80301 [Conidiobolus coronatus NRRL 28638]